MSHLRYLAMREEFGDVRVRDRYVRGRTEFVRWPERIVSGLRVFERNPEAIVF